MTRHHDEPTQPEQVVAPAHPLATSGDGARGVFSITVAAELVGTPAQSLRLYEARGLLRPERTAGGTRRYSSDDLQRLRRISDLQDEGINLAGIAMVLDLQDENSDLRTNPRVGAHPAIPTTPTQDSERSSRRPEDEHP